MKTVLSVQQNKNVFVDFAATCLYDWTSHPNTNVENGIRVSGASTIAPCIAACINNASCNGVDWSPSDAADRQCWMSGPWSGHINYGTAGDITHYDLVRHCEGA